MRNLDYQTKTDGPAETLRSGDLFGERAATWPKDGHRFICAPSHPMPFPQPDNTQWVHPDSKDDGRNDPYYDHYKCPNCGAHFACEVAE